MKVAVIGYGAVGMAVFSTLLDLGEIEELVLVGRNEEKIKGELLDIADGLAIRNVKTKVSGGKFSKLEGADVIVYTAGPPVKKETPSRLSVARDNIAIAKQISAEINRYNKDATIVVISNPLDIVVDTIRQSTGRPREKVIGTGTMLETARLKRTVAELLDVHPSAVDAWVVGEHGDSACIVWSWMRILGMTLDGYVSREVNGEMQLSKERIEELNHKGGFAIFKRKGNTCYGVAAVAARIVEALLHDTNEIMPVSVCLTGEYGIDGVALSVPCKIGKTGAHIVDFGEMTDDERQKLKASADVINAVKESAAE